MERYYVNTRSSLQLTSIALNEPHGPGGYSARETADTAPLAATKLDETRLERLRGSALNAMTDFLASNDPEYPAEASRAVLKDYKRRLRRIAFRSLADEQHVQYQSTITSAEIIANVEAAHASTFADAVLERAKRLRGDPAAGETGDDFDIEFEGFSDDEEVTLEDDVELQHAHHDKFTLHVTTGELFNTTSNSTLPYIDIASSLMQILLESSLSTHREWKDLAPDEQRCPLCIDDDTISDENKDRIWPSEKHLSRHMASTQVHSRYARWRRVQTTLQSRRGQDLLERAQRIRDGDLPGTNAQAEEYEEEAERWVCPYCPPDARTHISL